jgi:hypothetical protein
MQNPIAAIYFDNSEKSLYVVEEIGGSLLTFIRYAIGEDLCDKSCKSCFKYLNPSIYFDCYECKEGMTKYLDESEGHCKPDSCDASDFYDIDKDSCSSQCLAGSAIVMNNLCQSCGIYCIDCKNGNSCRECSNGYSSVNGDCTKGCH